MNESTYETKLSNSPEIKSGRAGDVVDTIYNKVSSLIIEFDIKPGERINEVKLSKYLSVSRTSLREALNRLYAKGMLDFVPNKGFYVKEFDANEIMQIFEARLLLETGIAKLVIEKASNEDLALLREYWDKVMESYRGKEAEELVSADAEFHERVAELTQNNVIVNQLKSINKRIQFIRWIRLKGQERYATFEEHYAILSALESRDEELAVETIKQHIDHRSLDIKRAMADGLLHIYSKKALNIN